MGCVRNDRLAWSVELIMFTFTFMRVLAYYTRQIDWKTESRAACDLINHFVQVSYSWLDWLAGWPTATFPRRLTWDEVWASLV